jgi:hypothetical protein
MHTSKVLRSLDFQYRPLEGSVTVDVSVFCPHYHTLDRVGVVSPGLEDGVRGTGYALLALTTAFYDVLRAHTADFFDYPHHFAFLDANEAGVRTRSGRLPLDTATMGAPWGGLDVWPDSNWITAPGTVTGMLKKVFDWQISRLFWPEDFTTPQGAEPLLPAHVLALLRTRLKTVYYYNTTLPTIAIHVTQQVEDLVQKSLARLPTMTGMALHPAPSQQGVQPPATDFPYVARYRHVKVQDFLSEMASCFASGA